MKSITFLKPNKQFFPFFFRVGKLILTKARGNNVVGDAEDITNLYKYKDGSNAERLAVYNAIRGVDR